MKKIWILLAIIGLVVLGTTLFQRQLNQTSLQLKAQTMEKEREAELAKLAVTEAAKKRLKTKADTALLYAKEKGFDLNHVFLVDFSIHSGKNRFFVWDYKTNDVAFSTLCAHGTGKDNNRSTYTDIKYSNVEGSLCSSLGKYKIGARSYSNWGINVHYKMHGLDETNCNAFKRIVVLHSYDLVPDSEIYPKHLPLGYSQGCPVIDNNAMTKIDNMLKKKDKTILLWIYN